MDFPADIEWSQLCGTSLWRAARARHDADAWRDYHGFGHPKRMYHYAKAFALPYDLHLDRAILTHDVIQTGSDPVGASADWLDAQLEAPDPIARAQIEKTREHRPGRDNRMILLDLGDFLYPEVRRQSTEAMYREGVEHHSMPVVLQSSFDYLTGLRERLREGVGDAPRADQVALLNIIGEIDVTLDETAARIDALSSFCQEI